MSILAYGAGRYGSLVGQKYSVQRIAQPAAGNSKLLKANSQGALLQLAQAQTDKFVATGRSITRGASGNSRISIKA